MLDALCDYTLVCNCVCICFCSVTQVVEGEGRERGKEGRERGREGRERGREGERGVGKDQD